MTDEIVQLKFSFPIPPNLWLTEFTLKYPLLYFNVLSALLLSENRANCLIQVKGINIDNFWKEFTIQQNNDKFQLLYNDANSVLINILIGDPWILRHIMTSQLLVRFPLTIINGKVSIELIASRNKIEGLFNNPKWKEINVSIKQIGQYCPDTLLSNKQSDILIHALKNGFFESPRKQTLSSLATELGLSPTALSENIRRITKKLGEQYLECNENSKNRQLK
jgi:hypothetical protein